jgi:hypothetical protein
MEFALPLYAVQRLANGCWLVRTQMGDPLWPAVDVVAGGRSPLPLEGHTDGLMGYVASVIRQRARGTSQSNENGA